MRRTERRESSLQAPNGNLQAIGHHKSSLLSVRGNADRNSKQGENKLYGLGSVLYVFSRSGIRTRDVEGFHGLGVSFEVNEELPQPREQ
ncbi:hypothetical protein SUGI_0919340 [Cryptomeria japonica]|nr:hypothetical protein SUGI_0919340 [Cryptomeria japonica]